MRGDTTNDVGGVVSKMPMSRKLAFSKEDTALQERALKELGVERIFEKNASGALVT